MRLLFDNEWLRRAILKDGDDEPTLIGPPWPVETLMDLTTPAARQKLIDELMGHIIAGTALVESLLAANHPDAFRHAEVVVKQWQELWALLAQQQEQPK